MTNLDILDNLAAQAPKHVHLWRFVAGTVFALQRYETIHPASAPTAYEAETSELLGALRRGDNPPPLWLKGFFYNAALMRLDAAWERGLRVLLNVDEKERLDGPKLYERLLVTTPSLPVYKDSAFCAVRIEVNNLKHRAGGVDEPWEKPVVLHEGLNALVLLLRDRFARNAS